MIKPVTAMNTLQSNPLTQSDIDDVNIESIQPLVTPAELKTYRDWETDRKSTRLNSSH